MIEVVDHSSCSCSQQETQSLRCTHDGRPWWQWCFQPVWQLCCTLVAPHATHQRCLLTNVCLWISGSCGGSHCCIHERLDQQAASMAWRDNYRHQVTTLARYVDQLIVLKHLLLYCRQLLLIHVPLTASSQSVTAIVDGSLPLLALNSVSWQRSRSHNSAKRRADHTYHIENVSLASSAMWRTVYK